MAALAAILLPSPLPAQITFQRTYGGAADDYSFSVQHTSDGGYIITGYTYSYGAGGSDVYLVKTDASGDTLWTRTYGGSEGDEGWSVRQTFDGGYVIAGFTSSFGAGGADVYLIKANADGDTQWTRTYGGLSDDQGYSICQTADSGFVVAGNTRLYGQVSLDVYVIRTDAHGDTLWTRTCGGSRDDEAWSVQQTRDTGYIVTGYTTSDGAGSRDFYLVRLDEDGDTLWTRTWGGSGYEYGWFAAQTADDGYVLCGGTGSSGAGGEDAYLAKTNSVGDVLWTKTFGGTSYDYGCGMRATADGGFVLTGFTSSFGTGGKDVYLVRTDCSGDTLWTKAYGGTGDDCGYSVQQTTDGGHVVAGYTNSFGAGDCDVYLIKTDSLGNVAVAEPKASPTRAPAMSLSCEPNPFRTRTAISLQLTPDSPAEMVIFDASGRCVRTLTVNRAPCTVWDGKDELGYALPSGAYFIRCDVAGEHATTRVVLQR
jgi:hypothetical protein